MAMIVIAIDTTMKTINVNVDGVDNGEFDSVYARKTVDVEWDSGKLEQEIKMELVKKTELPNDLKEHYCLCAHKITKNEPVDLTKAFMKCYE